MRAIGYMIMYVVGVHNSSEMEAKSCDCNRPTELRISGNTDTVKAMVFPSCRGPDSP